MRVLTSILLALSAAACAASGPAGGLVVIPPELERADAPPGKSEGNHAVYIYNVGFVHFDPIDIGNTYFPSYAFTQFSRIKLLTREATEGSRWGNIPIQHYGDLIGIKASVEKPDGKRVELSPSDFSTSVLVKDVVPGYDYKQTMILFPGLGPGDIITYSYTKRGRNLFWPFNEVDAPVLYSKFMVARPPQRTEIQPLVFDAHKLNPVKGEEKGMATGMAGYTGISRQATYDFWTATNVPPIISEQAMPSPGLLSTWVRVWQGERQWDWITLGTTYYKWFTHYGRPPNDIRDLTAKVIAGISEPRERAKAIYRWVKKNLVQLSFEDLTYVPREVEVATVDVKKVLREKNATSEQIANIMWLMLQAAGVDAYVVLTRSMFDPEVVEGLHDLYQFSIPLLALDDQTFLDTTNRFVPFGHLPWIFEGRKAMWLKGEAVSMRDLPVSAPSANKRTIEVAAEVETSGDAKVQVKFTMTGNLALAYRYFLASLQEREREEKVRTIVTLADNKAEIDDFAFENLDNPERDLVLSASYHVPGYSQLMRDRMVVKLSGFINHVACPVLGRNTSREQEICPYPTSDARLNPVSFPFKRYDEMNATVLFPKGLLMQALPKGIRTKEIESGTAIGVQTSYGVEEGALRVVRKFSVNERRVDKQGYPTLQSLIKQYLAQKDTLITLELPKMD